MASPRARRMRRVHKVPVKLDEVRNEINVTPLVDVCLVLLIIFMVIVPMLSRGKEVKLPMTESHREPQDTRQPIVALDEQGRIFVDKKRVNTVQEMQEVVADEFKSLIAQNNKLARGTGVDASKVRAGEDRVLVKGHANLTYGDVRPVIMALHDMSIPNIDLGTHEVKEEK